MSSEEFPKTIFFFGAGASKPADVGTTLELVDEFKNYLSGRGDEEILKTTLSEIIHHLGGTDVDIEQLMTALKKLETRDGDDLLKFYDSKTLKINNPDVIGHLLHLLRMFIQETTSVKEDKIHFLKPLSSFDKPVTVFSVNYDTVIEQFCNVYKLKYTDGFDFEWNPKLFEDTTLNFHLKKIHGSIMWYKTDNGNYVKLPLPPKDEIELIFGEKATPLLLYPMEKWEFVEPLLELLLQFKTQLVDVEFVIIVGYSFRDSHIVRLLHESARKNDNLIVLLVAPNSRNLYEEHLKYYPSENNQEKIPTMLKDRVLCLQYGFEQIIGSLRDIVIDCNANLIREKNYQNRILKGEDIDPDILINELSKIEFLEKADNWRHEIKWSHEFTVSSINPKLFAGSLRLFVIAEIQGKAESSDYWIKHFVDGFNILLLRHFAKVSIASNTVRFSNLDTITGYGSSREHLEDLQMFLDRQKNLRGTIFSPLAKDVVDKVTKWFYHVYETQDSLVFRDYVEKIKHFFIDTPEGKYPKELYQLFEMLDDEFLVKNYNENKENVEEKIREIEAIVLETIFGGFNNLSKFIEANHPVRYASISQKK